jgi:DNA-binding NarL/FixJ family response regulator
VLEVDEFLATASRVATGRSALDPTVVGTLVQATVGSPLARLSERERRVLAVLTHLRTVHDWT